MAYTKQNFENGQVLTAEHLNNMEQGIVDAVSVTAQTLTDGQKAQARGNIGAIDESQLPTITQEAGESESLVMSQKAVTDLVAEALGSGGGTSTEYETVDSVEEMTDTSKQYVLSSTGTIWAYGQQGEPEPQFTDLAVNFEQGRYNSSGAVTTSSATGAYACTDYINVKNGDVFYIKGFGACTDFFTTWYKTAGGTVVNSAKLNASAVYGTYSYDEETGIVTFTIKSDAFSVDTVHIRVSGIPVTTTDDVIITVNEEIAYSSGYAWYDTGMTPETGNGGGNYVELLVMVNNNAANIANNSKRLTALETGADTMTIPDFWQSAVDACIAKIKALQVGRDCVTFPFFSDNHQRNGYAGMLIAHIMKECHIPYCFYGGDSISNGTIADEATMIAQDKAFDTSMSYVPNGRFCRAVGNHDGYWYDGTNKYYYNRNQVYELFLREESIAQNKHFGDDGTYYYVDDIASKVRFIVLNTNEVDNTQLSWLQDTALSFSESGWAVVMISHHPIANYYHTNITNASDVISAVNSKDADIIGWFSGHIHRDRMTTYLLTGGTDTAAGTESTELGFTQVTITSDNTSIAYKNDDGTDSDTKHTTANDDQSHAIDFVTINKATRTVNITRLGIGSDRSYTY